MQRYLSMVLDNLCMVSKTLIQLDSYELDKYISSKFNNSSEVREYFYKVIDKFLIDNKSLIDSVEKRTKKHYAGQIVILSVLNDGSMMRVKVIYKKDLKKIKDEYINNQELMQGFINKHKIYFSNYIINKTKRLLSKSDFEYTIYEWYRGIKNSKNYFEMCRDLIKYKDLYTFSKNNIKVYNINKMSYDVDIDKEYDPDIDYHPDLDELAKQKYDNDDETVYCDDEFDSNEQFKKIKIKRKELPGQISFFD